MYIIFGLLSAFFASLVTIFGKFGLKKVDPIFATSVRSIIMAIFIVCAVFVLQKVPKGGLASLTGTDWLVLVGTGIAGALSWIFYFQALKMGPATRVASLDRLSLVFIALLSVLFFKEGFTIKSLMGLVFMLVGVYLLQM